MDDKTLNTVSIVFVAIFAGILLAVVGGVVNSQDTHSDPADTRKVESVIINVDKLTVIAETASDQFPEIANAEKAIRQTVEDAPNCISHQTGKGEMVFLWCDDGTEKGRVDEAMVKALMSAGKDDYDFAGMGTYVVSRLWSCSNYNCSSFTQTTSYAGMCSGSEYWLPSLAGYGWANVASSARSYGNCGRIDLYTNTNYGGGVLGCTQECTNLGALGFDNNTESTKTK